MNRATVIVSVLLGLSVAMNVGLIARSPRLPDPPPPLIVKKSHHSKSHAAPVDESAPASLASPAREVSPAPVAQSVAETATPPGPPRVLPSRLDPRVARILDDEEDFRVFWQDLGKVFGIQEKLAPEEYLRIVVGGSAEFLGLQEPQRSQFFEQTRAAIAEREQARKEYDSAKKALPPKDKNNAAVYAAARQPIDTAYQSKLKAAQDRVGALLDPNQVRHQEFAGKLSKWLKELEPIQP
jgi:hypothetical protein